MLTLNNDGNCNTIFFLLAAFEHKKKKKKTTHANEWVLETNYYKEKQKQEK